MEGSRDLESVAKELKPIMYQTVTYSKVTSVINRGVASLWNAPKHQKRGKAVGINEIDNETYEKGFLEKRIELIKYIPKPVRYRIFRKTMATKACWVFAHMKSSWFNVAWRTS